MKRVVWIVAVVVLAAGCGRLDRGPEVSGFPDVDLGVPVEVYKQTPQRDLHLHVFQPEDGADEANPRGAILFFHGGAFRTTRVPQFERQAQIAADNGMVGIVVEYRVTTEGTTSSDAITDGADAAAFVLDNATRLGIDPGRIAMSGSSAGGSLAVNAVAGTNALVLFNPAVSAGTAPFVVGQPTIVFHSREDTIVPFASAEGFCTAVSNCTMVAFDEGDHGFFNDDPAFTETTTAMIEFLQNNGW